MALRSVLARLSLIEKNELGNATLKVSGITKRIGQQNIIHATIFDRPGAMAHRQVLKQGKVVQMTRTIEQIPPHGDEKMSVVVTLSGGISLTTFSDLVLKYCKCRPSIRYSCQITDGERSFVAVLRRPNLQGIIDLNNIDLPNNQRIVLSDLTSGDVSVNISDNKSEKHEISWIAYNIQCDHKTRDELVEAVQSSLESLRKFGFINYHYFHPLMALSASSDHLCCKISYAIAYASIKDPIICDIVNNIRSKAQDPRNILKTVSRLIDQHNDPDCRLALRFISNLLRRPHGKLEDVTTEKILKKNLPKSDKLRWNQKVNNELEKCQLKDIPEMRIDGRAVLAIPESVECLIEESDHLRMFTGYESHTYQIRPGWITAGEDLNLLKQMIDPYHKTAPIKPTSLSVGMRAVIPISASSMALASGAFNVRSVHTEHDNLLARLNGL